MFIFALCFVAIALLLWMAKLVFRLLSSMSGFLTIVAMAVFFSYIWPSMKRMLSQPYPQIVKVTEAKIDWLPLPGDRMPGEHWFTLTIQSTYERPYKAQAAVCSVKGPVYYASRYNGLYEFVGAKEGYLGERRFLVTLFPASDTHLSQPWYHPPTIKAAKRFFGFGKIEPVEHQVIYLSTTPSDYIGMLDRIEWCKVGEDRNSLADALKLKLDQRGRIVGDRVTWIGDHANFPVERLTDPRVNWDF